MKMSCLELLSFVKIQRFSYVLSTLKISVYIKGDVFEGVLGNLPKDFNLSSCASFVRKN